jgi:mannose-6-phosphate isomerase-like protein (cupin superfamily)
VLEGELVVQVGEEVRFARPGDFVFAPPDTPHTFANFGIWDARMLVLCSPAGLETYLDRLAAGEQAVPSPDQAIAVGPTINSLARIQGQP